MTKAYLSTGAYTGFCQREGDVFVADLGRHPPTTPLIYSSAINIMYLHLSIYCSVINIIYLHLLIHSSVINIIYLHLLIYIVLLLISFIYIYLYCVLLY